MIDLAIVGSWFGVEKLAQRIEATTMQEVEEREEPGMHTLGIVRAYPIFGAGPGTFYTTFPQHRPPAITAFFDFAHNDYAQFAAETDRAGAFRRQPNRFTDRPSREPGARWPVEAGRYRLIWSRACPWAHRSRIVLGLLGLDVPAWLAAGTALILWTGAFFAEIWRGCVESRDSTGRDLDPDDPEDAQFFDDEDGGILIDNLVDRHHRTHIEQDLDDFLDRRPDERCRLERDDRGESFGEERFEFGQARPVHRPVRFGAANPARRFGGQSGFADTAGTDQGQQPAVRFLKQLTLDFGHFLFAANKSGRLRRQVVPGARRRSGR